MDWRLAGETEQALERIVALLFALAGLAERAAGRSRPVRALVLWLLLPAETVARNLVYGAAVPPPLRPTGDSPADAMRLASSLRSLAAAFYDLSRWAFPYANNASGLPGGCMGLPEQHIGAMASTKSTASQPRTPYDTS